MYVLYIYICIYVYIYIYILYIYTYIYIYIYTYIVPDWPRVGGGGPRRGPRLAEPRGAAAGLFNAKTGIEHRCVV